MADLYLSPSVYRNVRRDFGRDHLRDAFGYGLAGTFGGVPIYESRVFPHQWKCGTCDGTGEGETATYCPKCKGAGRIKAVGMMGTTIIIEPLPKAFLPSFPSGIVPLPPIARGLP